MKPNLTAIENRNGFRFDTWTRWSSLTLLLGTVGLVIYGLALGDTFVGPNLHPPSANTDAGLFRDIISDVQDGAGFYSASVAEMRSRGMPLQPFVTIREPALAYVSAAVGGVRVMLAVLIALATIISGWMILKLEAIAPNRWAWWASSVLFALEMAALTSPSLVVMHEIWAAFFMLLSLLCIQFRHFLPSVLFGLCAVLMRELALPFLLVMAVFAWREKKAHEALAWVGAIVTFVALFIVHATLVLSLTNAGDLKSPPWLRVSGWGFVLDTVRETSFLSIAPPLWTAILVPLALLGWLSRTGPLPDRVFALLLLFFASFTVIGRPENVYWGLMYVAVLAPGLAFAPSAILGLVRRIARPLPSAG